MRNNIMMIVCLISMVPLFTISVASQPSRNRHNMRQILRGADMARRQRAQREVSVVSVAGPEQAPGGPRIPGQVASAAVVPSMAVAPERPEQQQRNQQRPAVAPVGPGEQPQAAMIAQVAPVHHGEIAAQSIAALREGHARTRATRRQDDLVALRLFTQANNLNAPIEVQREAQLRLGEGVRVRGCYYDHNNPSDHVARPGDGDGQLRAASGRSQARRFYELADNRTDAPIWVQRRAQYGQGLLCIEEARAEHFASYLDSTYCQPSLCPDFRRAREFLNMANQPDASAEVQTAAQAALRVLNR